MIEARILDIVNELGSVVVILKGFDISQMPQEKKYFEFNYDSYDKFDIDFMKNEIVENILKNREFDDQYKWMSMEEYQLFKDQSILNKMPIVVLENNLYDKQFPYRGTLSNIEGIYNYLYLQEDKELEPDQLILFENVSYFYGQIDRSESSQNYYVTYPVIEEDIPVYYFYKENPFEITLTEEYPIENIEQIELSDNELIFLDLEDKILKGSQHKDIIFVLSGEVKNLPNRYIERLSILLQIYPVRLYFTALSIKRKYIENENIYLKILNDVYGYDHFKNIKFYKNIESHSKETIEISQAQIIDDIVTQADNAINKFPFRDIFITAATGAGKSLMFQIPAIYLAEKYNKDRPLTLVISPLIGLMNDQVRQMRGKGIDTSATINGNTPPYEKEQIIEKIQKQEIDVLYLSPETLQARSDIKMLIGDREIGVVIIDEAHIVTTWGKTFRADYWYLGIYLSKLRKTYHFPIVTFTATAIYGGKEDMYLDTRNSLNMISPIAYFGEVKRHDIFMRVKGSERYFEKECRDYRKTKNALALRHLKNAYKHKQKTLMYFPTIKLLIDFYTFLSQNEPEIAEVTGKYFGTLKKEERDEVLSEFTTGEMQYVLATKAFGMGIDIPDICNVYHYAPTGSVVDYIQEIGRAARDKSKVKYGYGAIDFLERDMSEIKRLYGMSAIQKNQIVEVMRKVLSLYKEKGYNRNLIISPEDFKYIFVQRANDEDQLDNKVKTVLLMIEKDFSSPDKLGYSPFYARPRTLYGNDLIFVTEENEKQFAKSRLREYFTKILDLQSSTYKSIYQVSLSGIWEKYYKNMSYPSFKYAVFKTEEREKLQDKRIIEKMIWTTGIKVAILDNISSENLLSQYRLILKSYEAFINSLKISEKQFTVVDLGNHLIKTLNISDKFEARAFAQTLINASFEFVKIKKVRFIKERTNSSSDTQRYIIYQDGDIFSQFIMNSILNVIKPNDNYVLDDNEIVTFSFRKSTEDIDSKLASLSIGEARNLLSYQVIGGNEPQIYIRMNSIAQLEKAIKKGELYKNNILKDIQTKHYTSVAMLKYLFTKKQTEKNEKERIQNYSQWFWDNIEDYFMGILPNPVRDEILKPLKNK